MLTWAKIKPKSFRDQSAGLESKKYLAAFEFPIKFSIPSLSCCSPRVGTAGHSWGMGWAVWGQGWASPGVLGAQGFLLEMHLLFHTLPQRTGTRWEDKGQWTSLETREVSTASTFRHWTGDPMKLFHLHPQRCSGATWSFQPELFDNSTTSYLPSLALMSFYFIHVFRHFYIIEKWEGNRHKTVFKSSCLNSDLYFCLFDHTYPAVLLSLA